MRTLVILPTYNERENIVRLCAELLVHPVDILIIDDNSPDGTGNIANGLAARSDSRIAVLHREGKLGLGSAIMAGFEFAIKNSYDLVINMDCDFSHDPGELPRMIEAANDSDLVIASRHVGHGHIVGWNAKRRLLHWLAQQYTNIILGRYVHDHTNSFKAYRVSMLKELPLRGLLVSGGGFVWHTLLIHIIHKKGYRIKEVPSVFIDRRIGKSKMSTREMLGGLFAILHFRLKSF